jgi:leucyl-tRNA synthetase
LQTRPSGPWQLNGIEGVYRFLHKVWRLIIDRSTGEIRTKITTAEPSPELLKLLHKTIKGVTDSIESIDKMNTAVSKLMEFVNSLSGMETIPITVIKDLLLLLSPLAPHISEELWERLGEQDLIAQASWPIFDEDLVVEDIVTIPVQIDGKMRSTIEVAIDGSEDELKQFAIESVSDMLLDKEVKRIVTVRGKIVNIVTG